MTRHYDAVVVGAGAVGCSFALGLAQQGREVLLVEAADNTPLFDSESHYDLRVFAISQASEKWFRHLGIWQNIVDKRVCAYTDMQVWDAGGEGDIHFDCQDIDRSHLGHIIENKVIVNSLQTAAQQHIRIDFQLGERVINASFAEEPGQLTHLVLQGAGEISADLMVAADGARSQLRGLAGIAVTEESYQQQGIVAVVKTHLSHRDACWQRFTATGPIAFLPLADGSCSIVWSADQARADELLALDDTAFADELGKAFEYRLGDIELLSSRAAFPLSHLHANEYVRPGLALLGDAAHVIHPLAGQGVNLGLLDAATLLEELSVGKALSALSPLRRYERRRRHANQLTASGMTALHHLFKSDNTMLKQWRNQGMTLAGDIAPLRRQLALRAAGLEGDTPKLLREQN